MADQRPSDMSETFLQRMSEITPRPISRLEDDLGMDRLDRVEFVMDLETAFSILIDDDVSKEWVRLEDVVESIKKLQGST